MSLNCQHILEVGAIDLVVDAAIYGYTAVVNKIVAQNSHQFYCGLHDQALCCCHDITCRI